MTFSGQVDACVCVCVAGGGKRESTGEKERDREREPDVGGQQSTSVRSPRLGSELGCENRQLPSPALKESLRGRHREVGRDLGEGWQLWGRGPGVAGLLLHRCGPNARPCQQPGLPQCPHLLICALGVTEIYSMCCGAGYVGEHLEGGTWHPWAADLSRFSLLPPNPIMSSASLELLLRLSVPSPWGWPCVLLYFVGSLAPCLRVRDFVETKM